jgi:ADP-heptose:LPS heptosyltransferase
MQDTGNYRPLYFARDKADKRPPLEQCQELSKHLKKTGFDVWVMGSDDNHLIFYGKSIKRP